MIAKTVWKRRLALLFWSSLAIGYSAMAAGVVIDVLKNGYVDLGQVQAITSDAPATQRSLAASQIAAVQRARSGTPFAALPTGSTMKIVWPDGSSEYVVIVDPSASVGVQPIAGTLRDSSGQVIGPDTGPASPMTDQDAMTDQAAVTGQDAMTGQAAEPDPRQPALQRQGQRVEPLRH